jgi:hypothetical protein
MIKTEDFMLKTKEFYAQTWGTPISVPHAYFPRAQ